VAERRGIGRNANGRVVIGLLGILAMMVALTASAVPLYNLFCRVTGYGGTTQIAERAPEANGDARRFTIRFDTGTARDLAWEFLPPAAPVSLAAGQEQLVFDPARNDSAEPVVGTATYNITPQKAGEYFAKIQCFCFTEQALAPGQQVDMPVSFFVDPQILEDPQMADVTTITLSYTFFRAQGEGAREKERQMRLSSAAAVGDQQPAKSRN
jgi:cytochrome c oxidase assembly protein subunit 11